MRYELMILIKPLTTEDVRDRILSRLESLAKKTKSEVKVTDFMGKRLLSYPVNGFKEGYYLVTEVNFSKKALEEVKKDLKINKDVLRYLFIRKDKK